MKKPPKVATNWFSILDTLSTRLDNEIRWKEEGIPFEPKRLKLVTPFYKYNGTLLNFESHRAEFRKLMLEYLERKFPEENWKDRRVKPPGASTNG